MSEAPPKEIWKDILPRQKQLAPFDRIWVWCSSPGMMVLASVFLGLPLLIKIGGLWGGWEPDAVLAKIRGSSFELLGGGLMLFVLLARALERLFRLWAPFPLPMQIQFDGWQRYLLLRDELGLDLIGLKVSLDKRFGTLRQHGPVFIAERGRAALVGEFWLLSAAVCVLSTLLFVTPWFPTISWQRVAMVMMPWLLFGLFMQLGEPHRCLALWKEGGRIFLWGASERGAAQLAFEMDDLEEYIRAQLGELGGPALAEESSVDEESAETPDVAATENEPSSNT